MSLTLSVIIPTLNEERYLSKALESLELIAPDEVIVVDGGSTDKTCEIAHDFGAKVILSDRGRGKQLKIGAEIAKGDLLFFMHADCQILNKICLKGIYKKGIRAGYFRLTYNTKEFSLKLLENLINLRAKFFHLPYGDQGLFIEKELYEKIGGFKEFPFLEDFDLILRLRKIFPPVELPGKILVSSRKFRSSFPFYPFWISLRNNLILLLFLLGVSPDSLRKIYK